jgi:hypothetical protein
MVESKGGDQDKLVQLHVDRWEAWEKFFKYLNWEELEDKREPRKKSKSGFEKAVVARGVTWAVRIFRKGEDYVEFDAGFGSMNESSDFDLNVVSTTPDVLGIWMHWTDKYVEDQGIGSFCEYWDSNFYYVPGLVIAGKKELKLIAYVDYLTGDGFRWTTRDTALYELQCVDAYTRAYEEGSDILVGDYRSRPNPEGISRHKEQSIYHASRELGEKFRTACENYLNGGSGDAVRYAYLQFAVTKVEGLICVTSLAICKVLRDKFFMEFVNKEDPDNPGEFKKWFKPYMAGISAYEMLRNLQMHVHNGKYKSKYAKRLIWVLMNNKGLCKSHEPRSKLVRTVTVDKWEDDPAASIIKNNVSSIHDIAKAIGFLLDFMDGIDVYGGGECDFMDSSEWEANIGETLDKLCVAAKAYVEGLIKEETSDKQSGVEYVKKLVKS